MTANIETELVEMTITALQGAQPALQQFNSIFLAISNAIDEGNNTDAMETLQQMTPRLCEFAHFCAALVEQTVLFLPESLTEELMQKCQSFSTIVGMIVAEGEEHNVIEIGDVLRFEMSDLIEDFIGLFGRMLIKTQEYQSQLPT